MLKLVSGHDAEGEGDVLGKQGGILRHELDAHTGTVCRAESGRKEVTQVSEQERATIYTLDSVRVASLLLPAIDLQDAAALG